MGSTAHAATMAMRAGIGVLERGGGPDIMPRVGLSSRLDTGLQLHLQVGATFTRMKADDGTPGDTIYEWQMLVGFGWRLVADEKYYIDMAAIAGPLFRQYPDRVDTDPAVQAPITFGIRLQRGFAIELRVAPGWERAATEVSPTGTWHRGNLMIEAGALIAYDFEPFAGSHRPDDF